MDLSEDLVPYPSLSCSLGKWPYHIMSANTCKYHCNNLIVAIDQTYTGDSALVSSRCFVTVS